MSHARGRWPVLVSTAALALGSAAQSTYLVRGLDFYFDPDTVVLQVGDSIRFQTQGMHDMVQTDLSDWMIGQAISNGGFAVDGPDTTFVIDEAGTYYFVCSPHGFIGMKGVLLVTGSTGAEAADAQGAGVLRIGLSPGIVRVESGHPRSARVELRDALGRRSAWAHLLPAQEALLDVPSSSYQWLLVTVLDEAGNVLTSRPVVISP